MRNLFPALLTIFALGGSQADAQPAVPWEEAETRSVDEDWVEEWITDIRTSRKACNFRSARKVKLRTIGAVAALDEQCVAVLAMVDRMKREATSSEGGQVGLYGRRHIRGLRGRRPYLLVGRVSDCATLWADFRNIANIGGYCHARSEGRILILSGAGPPRRRPAL